MMRRPSQRPLRTLGALAGALLLAGCAGNGDGPADPSTGDFDFSTILEDYARLVVVATYSDQAAEAEALEAAVQAMVASPGDQPLVDAAAEAWKAARVPWESSEAFLFGPAAYLGLDPALDSWPVDRLQLEGVLASDFELTPEFVAEGLGPALRGFHTIEFLLFRDGEARDAASIAPRELEYLDAITRVLADDSRRLRDAWDVGLDGALSYAAEFAGAGSPGSRYLTPRDAVIEMIDGMTTICDEVANGKIADPYDEKDPLLVESQFSFNSLDDFANNLRGVRNCYVGGYHLGASGDGLARFVEESDAELDARLRAEMQAAIDAIAAIPYPFRDNLDADEEIQGAQEAIMALFRTLEDDVKPLVAE